MRRRGFAFDFSHAAFASSVRAASGRMSYWSKSNWMSLSSGIAANSAGTGRTVVAAGAGAGVGVAGAAAGVLEAGSGALGAGADVAGGAAGAGTGGGGAATEVVAGRFAQPAATTPSSRSDITAM